MQIRYYDMIMDFFEDVLCSEIVDDLQTCSFLFAPRRFSFSCFRLFALDVVFVLFLGQFSHTLYICK